MGRLIDADKMIEDVVKDFDILPTEAKTIFSVINRQKTITIPKHTIGRWIYGGTEGWECSNCWRTTKNPLIYCPSCGSKNDRGDVKDERSE